MIKFPVRASIWTEYQLDQRINDCGVLVDINLATHALEISESAKESLLKRASKDDRIGKPKLTIADEGVAFCSRICQQIPSTRKA